MADETLTGASQQISARLQAYTHTDAAKGARKHGGHACGGSRRPLRIPAGTPIAGKSTSLSVNPKKSVCVMCFLRPIPERIERFAGAIFFLSKEFSDGALA
jgi:hypothetical protein